MLKSEQPGLRLVKQKGLSFFQFPHLRALSGVQHAIFTRLGGYSLAPYGGLNVSFDQNDNPIHVGKNRGLIADCFPDSGLIFVAQQHGADVVVVDQDAAAYAAGHPAGKTVFPPAGDAMVTNIPRRQLTIQVADCQAVLLFDPVRRVAANAHCGWRGSIQNIILKTITVMQKRYGTCTGDIMAGIGPSLGPCCAEFVNYKTEIPEKFWKYQTDAHYFDFWSLSLDQLCEAGVKKENICQSGICTRCRSDLFYSYRKEGRTGRFAVSIGIR